MPSTSLQSRRGSCPFNAFARSRIAYAADPDNAVTVLDTHDGIGVIDVSVDQTNRALAGLRAERRVLADTGHLLAVTHWAEVLEAAR